MYTPYLHIIISVKLAINYAYTKHTIPSKTKSRIYYDFINRFLLKYEFHTLILITLEILLHISIEKMINDG